MANILPLIWVVGVLALYGVAWAWLSLALGSVRYRKGLPELAALAILLVLGTALLPVPPPFRLVLMSILVGGALWGYSQSRVPKAHTGPEVRQRKEDRRQAGLHLALLTGGAIFIIPFVWLITTSLKEDEDIFRYPPVWIPRQQVQVTLDGAPHGLARIKKTGQTVLEMQENDTSWVVRPYADGDAAPPAKAANPFNKPLEGTVVSKSDLESVKTFSPRWKNYLDALTFLPPETLHGAIYLWNTILVTLLNIAGVLISSSLVAFAFARLRWPGRDLLFVLMLSTMMLPSAVTLIPVFLIYRSLGWVDTLQPLWVGSFFAAPFSVFLLRQFFLTIPNDLEDAARIDGCSYFRIYWNIMLPLIKPALAALTILAFMGSWNNFIGPLIYISSPEKMTLAYALRLFQSAHTSEYGMLMAASTLVMLPVLLVFFFSQRYFIEGVTLTGMKG